MSHSLEAVSSGIHFSTVQTICTRTRVLRNLNKRLPWQDVEKLSSSYFKEHEGRAKYRVVVSKGKSLLKTYSR